MTLFEIDANIREFLDGLYSQADEDGVVGDVDFEALEAWQEDRKKKLENTALYIKELVAEQEALEAEAKKLAQRAKVAGRRAEWLKNYVANSMLENGEKEFRTSRCVMTFRKSEKVIVDEDLLPRKYFVEKVDYAPDKKLLKQLLSEGRSINGAHIEVSQNIQIK